MSKPTLLQMQAEFDQYNAKLGTWFDSLDPEHYQFLYDWLAEFRKRGEMENCVAGLAYLAFYGLALRQETMKQETRA